MFGYLPWNTCGNHEIIKKLLRRSGVGSLRMVTERMGCEWRKRNNGRRFMRRGKKEEEERDGAQS